MTVAVLFQALGLRNFLSFGQNETVIDLSDPSTVFVEGRNLDQGGSNGSGKTALINALCYVLFNKPFDAISLQRLINSTNASKDTLMEVWTRFTKGTVEYEIGRTRGEHVSVRILKDGADITPGKGAVECDALIQSIIGVSYELFTRTIIFSGNAPAFLQLPMGQQRGLIEELFNITLLSERAVTLKELIKQTESDIKVQEAVVQQQAVALERHQRQVQEAEARVTRWAATHAAEVTALEREAAKAATIDLDLEERLLLERTQLEQDLAAAQAALGRAVEAGQRVARWDAERARDLEHARRQLVDLEGVDFADAQAAHAEHADAQRELTALAAGQATQARDLKRLTEEAERLLTEQRHLEEARCPYCTQHYAEAHTRLDAIKAELATRGGQLLVLDDAVQAATAAQVILRDHLEALRPRLRYAKLTDLVAAERSRTTLEAKRADLERAVNPHLEALSQQEDPVALQAVIAAGKAQAAAITARVTLPSVAAVTTARQSAAVRQARLTALRDEPNPHLEAHQALAAEACQAPETERVDALRRRLEHQQFLLKLLVNKDSFLRHRIINRSIPFLNSRVNHWTLKLGLPHIVRFDADLSCTVSEFGREMDFGNLSAGEKKRVNVGMALAFRDVYHHLHARTNLLLLDELDGQLDDIGLDAIVKVLKEKSRDDGLRVFVISHHPSINGRLDSTLTVVKQHGFSQIVEGP